MEIISNTVLRWDFSKYETTDKNMYVHTSKTVKYTFIWQAVCSFFVTKSKLLGDLLRLQLLCLFTLYVRNTWNYTGLWTKLLKFLQVAVQLSFCCFNRAIISPNIVYTSPKKLEAWVGYLDLAMKHSMFFRIILISNISYHSQATCLILDIRKYSHFSVKSNKIINHPIYSLYFQTAYIYYTNKFDNKLTEPFEHAVLMKGRGDT